MSFSTLQFFYYDVFLTNALFYLLKITNIKSALKITKQLTRALSKCVCIADTKREIFNLLRNYKIDVNADNIYYFFY